MHGDLEWLKVKRLMSRKGEILVNSHLDTEDDNRSEREEEEKN